MVQEVTDTAQQEQSFVDGKDEWALEYIGVHHVRPLIEAIDVDMSSFVSIAEINAFTAARPVDWRFVSLWIEMACHSTHVCDLQFTTLAHVLDGRCV